MALYGVRHISDEEIYASHNEVLQKWQLMYGLKLLIALTDTFGSEVFFRDMTPAQALDWKGLRQDSGDPFQFGRQAIQFYQRMGIDPLTKLIIFSDGLDLDKITALYECFHEHIMVSFGWGTNLTNDLGFSSLSIVMKMAKAFGHDTVKLSDNLAKATGPQAEIERAKRIFGYTGTLSEECRY